MSDAAFLLDPRLAAETHLVGEFELARVLLFDDARFPWLVLVPRLPGKRDLIDLSRDQQHRLLDEIDRASHVLHALSHAEKMNVAALGNVVAQLHVHIVARFAAAQRLRAARLPGVLEVVPAYASVLLRVDAAAIADPAWLEREALRLAGPAGSAQAAPVARLHRLPVCYGGEYGPDLEAVAAHTRMDAGALIARHAAAEYRVALLGFAPGFAYLLGLDRALHTPRRDVPRTRVPAGSVAIGGAQTGIYPRELPGGWQVIGRTPLCLFDAGRDPPARFAPGDRVRFEPVDADEFVRRAAAEAVC
jgi:KipI family sensor histidine kinase inhibitor